MTPHRTSTEAAEKLGMTNYRLLYILRVERDLEPKIRIGGRRMFTPEDIERIRTWQKSRKNHSTKFIPAAV